MFSRSRSRNQLAIRMWVKTVEQPYCLLAAALVLETLLYECWTAGPDGKEHVHRFDTHAAPSCRVLVSAPQLYVPRLTRCRLDRLTVNQTYQWANWPCPRDRKANGPAPDKEPTL
jgi:hypothetical protein